VVSGAGAGYVEEVALGVVDFLEIGIIAYGFDAFLEGDDFIVAGHDGYGAEFQALGQVHGADGDVAAGGFDVFIKYAEGHSGRFYCRLGALQLSF
jgi:hypothetical protein